MPPVAASLVEYEVPNVPLGSEVVVMLRGVLALVAACRPGTRRNAQTRMAGKVQNRAILSGKQDPGARRFRA